MGIIKKGNAMKKNELDETITKILEEEKNNNVHSVVSFCDKKFKSGMLVPTTYKFPSFDITQEDYIRTGLEIVSDRVRLGIDSKKYGHTLITDMSYDKILEAQLANSENSATQLQKGLLVFAEKILPKQIEKDSNMESAEINRKILGDLCDSKLKYSFANIEFNIEPNAARMYKTNFAATMLMLKHAFPATYRQAHLSLRDHPNQELLTELNGMIKDPDALVLMQIDKLDPALSKKIAESLDSENKNSSFQKVLLEIAEGNRIFNKIKNADENYNGSEPHGRGRKI